ncbi:MAG: type III pantothenate kinase [Bacteroidota bacterium]
MQCDFIVDIGNSNFKVAALKNNEIAQTLRFDKKDSSKLIQLVQNKNVIISNVAANDIHELLSEKCNLIYIAHSDTKFPFDSEYKTMESWGMDRACNIAAAIYKFPNKNVLIIDIGTCIKFDFIDETNTYKGGSISPGIRLRFESLAMYTAKLPLVQPNVDYSLIGNSTSKSILYGVLNGCKNEIQGFIKQYEAKFEDLKIIITGGDAFYFDFKEKSNIFADENLTLIGLHQLYLFNAG